MLGVRLDEQTERGLAAIARQTKRPKSQIAREAIRAYVERHDRDAIAREQWKAICNAERADPDSLSYLDGMMTDLAKDL